MRYSMDDFPGSERVPDLTLLSEAGCTDAAGLRSGHSSNPTLPPLMPPPSLQGSPAMAGIDPLVPIPELNLAGVDGVPSLQQLSQTSSIQIHEPDFGLPDFARPALQPYDLTEPGIDQSPNPLFGPDPLLPDLEDYHRPYGLTFHNQNPDQTFRPDLLLDEPLDYDPPQSLELQRDIQDPDPLLPDLQHPELTQAMHMQQRPAELDPDAFQQLLMQPDYQALSDVPYRQVFMDQTGLNSSRRRHYDLLLSQYAEKGEA